ncbi:hypothetical protein [Flavobacterium poyangense]|uniref:hypothetical protein n=1 Tax=Flavobacterium poyangense TaxID=2204302 RepID=UPI00141EA7B8|nr:hypothetical protein [Flavobacterium sp. JXAS1]
MEYNQKDYTGKISPKKAQKILKEEGMDVTLEKAEEILYFLRKLADIQVLHFLGKKEKKE